MSEHLIVGNEAAGGDEEPLHAEDAAGSMRQGGRRAFVEPEVSFPVDVLEATTFFQFTESGVTN